MGWRQNRDWRPKNPGIWGKKAKPSASWPSPTPTGDTEEDEASADRSFAATPAALIPTRGSGDVRNSLPLPPPQPPPVDQAKAHPSKLRQAYDAHEAKIHQNSLKKLRDSFERARSFEDDHLYFREPHQWTRHHAAEATERAKNDAAKLEALEAKRETERIRKLYQKTTYYNSPVGTPKSAAKADNSEAVARQSTPRTRHEEAPTILPNVSAARGHWERLGVFKGREQGHISRGATSTSGQSSNGDGGLDPTAYTFKPKEG